MPRFAFVAALLVGCSLWFLSVPSSAAGKKKAATKTDAALGAVEKVLRAEVAGAVDRRGQLAESLQEHPDSPAARWQAGFVRRGAEWVAVDDQTVLVEDYEKLREYRNQRAKTAPGADGQLALADWCRKSGLMDLEETHLLAALRLSPEKATPERLARLGFRQAGGQWLSREECQEWFRTAKDAAESIQKWESKITRVAEELSGPRTNAATASRKLKQIADPSAVPAVEYLLAGKDEESALLGVEILKAIDGVEATLALARQAVFSTWGDARRSAAAALKDRPLDAFVPSLIRLLSVPATAQFSVYDAGLHGGSNPTPGALYYSLILARETIDQFQVATLRTVNLMAGNYLGPGSTIATEMYDSRGWGREKSGIDNSRVLTAFGRGRSEAVRSMNEQLYFQRRTIDEYNDRTTELNERIGVVLATVSGQPPTADARAWWGWWSQFADIDQPGDKQVVKVEVTELVGNPNPTPLYVGPVPMPSCFAAGTQVLTETGLTSIEKISVGDRVLAKDVQTGELAYKPVLQTTVRPPKELTTLRFGDETIVCTGGHRFWSSGSGWIKARDLAPQTLLHTVTGNTPVWSAKKGNTAETYNLVVADFHTYFVGKTGVLCQDLLIPRSTDNVVPGLPRAQAAAQK